MAKKTNILLSFLLITLVVALYGQFLSSPIVFDDLYFFTGNYKDNQPAVSTYRFALFELRSLPYSTLAWTKAFFGLELIFFRGGNLLLHVAVVLVLFPFLSSLFSAVYGKSKNQSSLSPSLAAFFAALLFALHPVATYAAGYLIQRTIVMSTLFSLLALLVYVQGSVRQKPLWQWMSVPFYYLAVFSKEHAIMLPAVLIALTVLLHDDWWLKLKQRWLIFATLAVIAMFAMFVLVSGINIDLLGSVYEPNGVEMLRQNNSKLAYPLSVITQSWLFFKYALLWVVPNPAWMSIDMREPFARSLFSPYMIAAVGFLAWGVGAFWLLLKRGTLGLVGFALLFPWLMFFTEFSTVRIQDVFVLYRSYLWATGAFCLLPVVFSRLSGHSASLVLTLIALAMFPMSVERLMTLSHPVLLWDDAEKLVKGRTDLPGAFRIYHNRGAELLNIGSLDQAIADLKKSIALHNDFAEAHGNLGAAYLKKGDFPNSVASFSKAIDITQNSGKSLNPRYVYGRAQASEKMGELEKAQADYRESCRVAKRGCDKLSAESLSKLLRE